MRFLKFGNNKVHDVSQIVLGTMRIFEGVFLGSEKFPKLNEVLNRIANERGVTNTAVALARILRCPGKMQAVIGTTKPSRVVDSSKACDFELTRREWYEIYLAAGNKLP